MAFEQLLPEQHILGAIYNRGEIVRSTKVRVQLLHELLVSRSNLFLIRSFCKSKHPQGLFSRHFPARVSSSFGVWLPRPIWASSAAPIRKVSIEPSVEQASRISVLHGGSQRNELILVEFAQELPGVLAKKYFPFHVS